MAALIDVIARMGRAYEVSVRTEPPGAPARADRDHVSPTFAQVVASMTSNEQLQSPSVTYRSPGSVASATPSAQTDPAKEPFEITNMGEYTHPNIDGFVIFVRFEDDLFSDDRAGVLVELPRPAPVSAMAPRGRERIHFSFEQMPQNGWISFPDLQGNLLPFRVFIEGGVRVFGRWL